MQGLAGLGVVCGVLVVALATEQSEGEIPIALAEGEQPPTSEARESAFNEFREAFSAEESLKAFEDALATAA